MKFSNFFCFQQSSTVKGATPKSSTRTAVATPPQAKSTPRTPTKRSAAAPVRLIAEKIPAKSPTKSPTASKSPATSPTTSTTTPKKPLSSVERRKRHRLSQARVQLTPLDAKVIRTRNALVAEFKENNIMTRKRQSLDQGKSPTQKIERLKKITPATAAAAAANSSSAATTRKSSRSSSASNSKNSSPSSTPLPKRRSVSGSPLSSNLKMLSQSNNGRRSGSAVAQKTATAVVNTTKSNVSQPSKSMASKIPKRSASAVASSSAASSRQSSPATKRRQPNNLTQSSPPNRSRLPLRKGNRSTSLVTLRKK